jgi:arsenite/tail-anchored protein-transporting ATPase
MKENAKYYFFSGKGGVGKTTMASSTAVYFAEKGSKTLIITTDPASNLADAFEQTIGHQVTAVESVANLWAMELDPQKATEEYKERALAPYREIFDETIVAVMEEQLNSPCTEEMASFDKFVDFIDNPDFDIIIFDTAPTGHTVRLLELPVDWSKHISESEQGSGQTCLGPVQVLQDSRAKYDRAIETLQDPQQTTFVFVVQPEATPVKETIRAVKELEKIGIESSLLIINGIIPQAFCNNRFLKKRSKMQQEYLEVIETTLQMPKKKVYLMDTEIKGWELLRKIGFNLWEAAQTEDQDELPLIINDTTLIKSIENPNVRDLIMPKDKQKRNIFFAGKGGVGKTSVSCITALWLARQGVKTLLITTDPAAHIGEVLEADVQVKPNQVSGVANLWAAKIDPKETADEYKKNILDDAKNNYSEDVITIMKEQLDSPCTEEMAVFNKFMDYFLLDDYEAMVFDTAPTGHTLRLLELPMDWNKQMELKSSSSLEGNLLDQEAQARFSKVIEIMRNPDLSTFGFVVYPENTPIMEAYRAVEELKTVDVSTSLIISNMILASEFCTNDFFKQRRIMQLQHLNNMPAKFNSSTILQLPLMENEIKGLSMLDKCGELLFNSNKES